VNVKYEDLSFAIDNEDAYSGAKAMCLRQKEGWLGKKDAVVQMHRMNQANVSKLMPMLRRMESFFAACVLWRTEASAPTRPTPLPTRIWKRAIRVHSNSRLLTLR
jgi:hypothetical protein